MEDNPTFLCDGPIANLLEELHDRAIALSEAIIMAKNRGITVSIQKAPPESEHVIQLIFLV